MLAVIDKMTQTAVEGMKASIPLRGLQQGITYSLRLNFSRYKPMAQPAGGKGGPKYVEAKGTPALFIAVRMARSDQDMLEDWKDLRNRMAADSIRNVYRLHAKARELIHPFSDLLKGRSGYLALRFRVDTTAKVEADMQPPPQVFLPTDAASEGDCEAQLRSIERQAAQGAAVPGELLQTQLARFSWTPNTLKDLWPIELGALLQFHCEPRFVDLKRLMVRCP